MTDFQSAYSLFGDAPGPIALIAIALVSLILAVVLVRGLVALVRRAAAARPQLHARTRPTHSRGFAVPAH